MDITYIRKLKAATKALTKWDSTNQCFGHFHKISDNVGQKKGDVKGSDRIYEFYCLLRILEYLSANYDVTLIPGTRTDKIFPEAPADKNGWPYFEITNKKDPNNQYQICYGTNIKVSGTLTTIAPDISFQEISSTDSPNETMVEMILDAKYKFNNTNPLSIDQIHAFMNRVTQLETKDADRLPIVFDKHDDIKSNCLLTNGKGLVKHDAFCKKGNIKQVVNFDIHGAYSVIG
jgi:hypothetical protein